MREGAAKGGTEALAWGEHQGGGREGSKTTGRYDAGAGEIPVDTHVNEGPLGVPRSFTPPRPASSRCTRGARQRARSLTHLGKGGLGRL
ncbi:hypothetical protein E2C01_066545 [Portunus trituberculatus]|uniref:Uncharacterized protein n=1 Tax=Portunus trituberculatus TaxID=210409 RepID=A0A5B7HSL6_PORTR|nr:hypothetical protein [Portunus trituberculatus]